MVNLAALMLPAVWRGVPFLVREESIRVGRRVAMHEYPYRDMPWPEDMGRAPRILSFSARLVGDDVILQRTVFAAACELKGAGLLIHPTLGPMKCALLEPPTIRMAALREVEFELTFVEAASRLYPNLLVDTQNAILVAAAAAVLTIAGVLASVLSGGSSAAPVALGAQGVASAWGGIATTIGQDPAAIGNEASGLTSYNGRYAGGMLATPAPAGATLASQQLAVVTSRTAIDTAVAALAASAATVVTQPAACSTQARAVIVAVRGAAISPADQIRLLTSLAQYQPNVVATTAPIGAAIAATQTALGNLLRRAALIGLAEAVASLQPDSADAAQAMMDTLVTLLDAEILAAADAGDGVSYAALRDVRTAVVQDLSQRGANLAHIVQYSFNASMPAIALAWTFYQDPTRVRDLVNRADAPHPLFMPTQFEAIDS
jgi:prophage DNA circulation protein